MELYQRGAIKEEAKGRFFAQILANEGDAVRKGQALGEIA